MNKQEFQQRMNEGAQLIEKKNFSGAVDLFDELNLDGVKDPRILQNIAKAYEKCRRYADAEDLLKQAKTYAPRSRGTLFHLCTVAVKGGDLAAANDYYREFCQIAKYDAERYVLQYRIAQAEGNDDEVLIKILENFKGEEPDDRWMYELAKLYTTNGRINEALEVCDEITLWFYNGKYVQLAKELRAYLTGQPLDPNDITPDDEMETETAQAEAETEPETEAEAESEAETEPEELEPLKPEDLPETEETLLNEYEWGTEKDLEEKAETEPEAQETTSYGNEWLEAEESEENENETLTFVPDENAFAGGEETAPDVSQHSIFNDEDGLEIREVDEEEKLPEGDKSLSEAISEAFPSENWEFKPDVDAETEAALYDSAPEMQSLDDAEPLETLSAGWAVAATETVRAEREEVAETVTAYEEATTEQVEETTEQAEETSEQEDVATEGGIVLDIAAEADKWATEVVEKEVIEPIAETTESATPVEEETFDGVKETQEAQLEERAKKSEQLEDWAHVSFSDEDEHVVFTVTGSTLKRDDSMDVFFDDSIFAPKQEMENAAEDTKELEGEIEAETKAKVALGSVLTAETVKVAAPKAEETVETVKVEAPKAVEDVETVKVEAPKPVETVETVKVVTPKVEAPKAVETVETVKTEAPKTVETVETVKTEAPKAVEAVKTEAPEGKTVTKEAPKAERRAQAQEAEADELEEKESWKRPSEELDELEDLEAQLEKKQASSEKLGKLPIEPEIEKGIWHFIVFGENEAETLERAQEILKEFAETIPGCPKRMLKTSAKRIENADIIKSLDHFLGSMVIIQNAASLSDRQLQDFAKILEKDDNSLLIVFTDTEERFEKLFTRVPVLGESFTAAFEGHLVTARDLVDTAKEYLYYQNALMTKEAEGVCYEFARKLLAAKEGFYRSDIREYAAKALHYAEHTGLFGLFSTALDDDGYLHVAEKFFTKAGDRL